VRASRRYRDHDPQPNQVVRKRIGEAEKASGYARQKESPENKSRR
jgi:hypothetical protein